MILRLRRAAQLLLLGCIALGSAEQAQPTLVMLPDTQVYCREHPDLFYQQTSWIAANVRTWNIRFVCHVGDIVDGNDKTQWAVANRAMSMLDGVVPWSVAIGNHDYDLPSDPASPATAFLRYFGPERFKKFPWFRGASANGLNSCAVFRLGGRGILVLHLELDVPDGAVQWAESVLKANPGHPVILVTHVYLNDRTRSRDTRPYLRTGGNSGEELWQKLVRTSPQIFMVLCGHWSKPGEWHQVSVNDRGGAVIEMLADYQSRPNGGDGWLRLISFDGRKREIQVRTFSPPLNRFETDNDSQFTLPFPAPLRSR
jgi:hypothetical protein